MRASPRTCPSIRPSLFSVAALASCRMAVIYPRRVSGASMTDTVDHDHHHGAAEGVVDPVCGMTVDPHTAKHRHTHRGHTYYLCSARCRTKFAGAPEKYLDKDGGAEPVPQGTIYTCPMHPEIRQIGP